MISSSSVDPTLLRSFFFIVTLIVLHFFIIGGHALHRRSSGDRSPTVSSHFPEECDPISMGTRSEMPNCISQLGAASKQMFPATKRDLQRELEQVESGLRPARREFSTSTHSSRPRERYRERENGRSSTEGNLRTTSGSLQTETGTSNSSLTTMPSVVLAGSRPFSGQVPTILQSRDRLDDGGSSYEENFDGSKDSGDTGSIGDADLVSALEGQPGGVGSAQRHGSRGSKSSRQMIERRERDGRREGKWERKHY